MDLHKVATKHEDAQLTDYLEGEYLKEQVKSIKELADLITKMKRAGDTVGLHIIDKELQSWRWNLIVEQDQKFQFNTVM